MNELQMNLIDNNKNLLALLKSTKLPLRAFADFIFTPVRFLLPDKIVERLYLTSLRSERMGIALKYMKGRCLDIGCNDNLLINIYNLQTGGLKNENFGVDVVDWGGDGMVINSSSSIPFEDSSFDTITLLASLNHIPQRQDVLLEAYRLLKPDGQLLITMISSFTGSISHRIRFWGEHSQREMQAGETFGMDKNEVLNLLKDSGLDNIEVVPFLYGFNNLFIVKKSPMPFRVQERIFSLSQNYEY